MLLQEPQDGWDYIQIVGRTNNERVYKFIRRDYVNDVINLDKYKILLPKANGSGILGEVLSTPIIAAPHMGSTETFLSIGVFETSIEAEAALKYIKTKFAPDFVGSIKNDTRYYAG